MLQAGLSLPHELEPATSLSESVSFLQSGVALMQYITSFNNDLASLCRPENSPGDARFTEPSVSGTQRPARHLHGFVCPFL